MNHLHVQPDAHPADIREWIEAIGAVTKADRHAYARAAAGAMSHGKVFPKDHRKDQPRDHPALWLLAF